MRVFDKINPQGLERREFQLGILAISTIGIMAAGLAVFMHQTVFSDLAAAGDPMTRRIFFAFCALSTLMVAYLLNRQVVIYQLRRKLSEDQNRLTQIRDQASSDLLRTLPGMSRFQDRLAMEFRRTVNSRDPLTVLLFLLNPNSPPSDENQITNIYGDAAKAILLKMRNGNSLYLFESGTFGVVLPGITTTMAGRLAERFSLSLMNASDSGVRFSFMSRVINFPEECGTAREMEQAVRSVVPVRVPSLPLQVEDETFADAACGA
ncbi:MAG TPA: hypothetical protein VKV95_00385 [Terriglobia bacterium]|nr:hypothetical protein [Terriglobia bacterium]